MSNETHTPPFEKPCDIMYHIFSDGVDEYEEDLEKALSICQEYLENGQDNIRIYKQTEWDEDEGIFEDGDCIFSIGQWPN